MVKPYIFLNVKPVVLIIKHFVRISKGYNKKYFINFTKEHYEKNDF